VTPPIGTVEIVRIALYPNSETEIKRTGYSVKSSVSEVIYSVLINKNKDVQLLRKVLPKESEQNQPTQLDVVKVKSAG